MAQNTLPTNIKTFSVISAIVLSLGIATPSAFAGGTSGKKSEKTIVLTGDHAGEGTLGLDTEIEEPSTTNGVGGQDLFSDDLRYQDGEVAGRNSGVCVTTSPFDTPDDLRPAHQGANLCTIGFVLFDRGKITVSGIVTNDDFALGRFVLPVTGGTGEFHKARGEFEVKFAPVFTDPATLTFRLK